MAAVLEILSLRVKPSSSSTNFQNPVSTIPAQNHLPY